MNIHVVVPAGTRSDISKPEVDVILIVYSSRSNCPEFSGGAHVIVILSDSLKSLNSTERFWGWSGISAYRYNRVVYIEYEKQFLKDKF